MNSVVEVQNLTVQFGDFKAVNNISFRVFPGQIFGFLGANGAGKTTTIRVLCGLLTPSSGKAEILGHEVQESNFGFIKSKVGYMSQKFTLYNDLSVQENLSFAADLRKIKRSVYLEQQQKLLEFISFSKPLNTLVADLPGGMKQQVALVTALIHDPEIVFLDEPTAGVSPSARALFWDLIRKLVARKKTIFVTSHYMDEVEQCENIALMRDGQIIALNSPEGLKKEAFPEGLLELEGVREFSLKELASFKNSTAFGSFQYHGLRYHAMIKDVFEWDKIKTNFEVTHIKPSLEDVFIQLVEGKKP